LRQCCLRRRIHGVRQSKNYSSVIARR
jgi:hypothetical protein